MTRHSILEYAAALRPRYLQRVETREEIDYLTGNWAYTTIPPNTELNKAECAREQQAPSLYAAISEQKVKHG